MLRVLAQGEEPVVLPPVTAMGSMANYITATNAKNFQPMNANFGLFAPLEKKIKKKAERNEAYAKTRFRNDSKFCKYLVKFLAKATKL